MKWARIFGMVSLILGTLTAAGASAQDRVTFGGDVVVRAGETVDSVVTLGGDARIEGRVLGDVVTMGGKIELEPGAQIDGDAASMGGPIRVGAGARVDGDVVGMGGNVTVDEGGVVGGETNTMGGDIRFEGGGHAGPEKADGPFEWFTSAVEHVVSYALLFLLGLLLIGLFRDRFDGLQVTLIRRPFKSLGTGLLAFLGGLLVLLVLVVSIIGIPVAVVLGVIGPLALYVGLAAAAAVVGTALPLERLRDRPILQLGAGVATLFLASLIPFLGELGVFLFACAGLGALVWTRFKPTPELHFETQ